MWKENQNKANRNVDKYVISWATWKAAKQFESFQTEAFQSKYLHLDTIFYGSISVFSTSARRLQWGAANAPKKQVEAATGD